MDVLTLVNIYEKSLTDYLDVNPYVTIDRAIDVCLMNASKNGVLLKRKKQKRFASNVLSHFVNSYSNDYFLFVNKENKQVCISNYRNDLKYNLKKEEYTTVFW
jgi:hypothetical protein